MLLFRCLFEFLRTPSVLLKNFRFSSLCSGILRDYIAISSFQILSDSAFISNSNILHYIIWNSESIVTSTTKNLYYQCLQNHE